MTRLEAIEKDMAVRQLAYEASARAWVLAVRQQKHDRAVAFLGAEGTVAERSAIADRDTSVIGTSEEAEYVALKAVMQTLSERASIGQSILRAQGRA